MGLQQPAGCVGNAYGYVAATVVIIAHQRDDVSHEPLSSTFSTSPPPQEHSVSLLSLHMQKEVIEKHSG